MNETAIARPTPDQIREQLRRILASPLFTGARRLSQFLDFVVSRSIEGQAAEIKESLIGVEVYSRPPTYDPKADSIVRAEASRLRAKLREYYEIEGRVDPIRIELPKGSYTPAFVLTSNGHAIASEVEAEAAPKGRRGRRLVLAGGGLLLLALVALGALVWRTGHAARHSIAVMPLTNLGSDNTADALSDTLTEEITRGLLNSSEWKVAGRAPVLDLTGRNQMLAPLRENLRADVVLTGSYRVGENSNFRLNLQLVNVADGYLLWTETYHRPLTQLAESTRELARAVIGDFTQKFTGRASPPRTKYYTQARELWSTYSEQGLEQSLKLFQQAIEADPGFAPAWAGLADANARLADRWPGQPTQVRVAEARRAAAKAISLDDGNAEAHATLGKIYLYRDWNFQGAARQLQRAVALDPVRVSPNVSYGEVLTILGDIARAEEAIQAARSRLPRNPELVFEEGSVFFLARQWDKMEAAGRELTAIEPTDERGHWLIGLSLELRGQPAKAIEEFNRGMQVRLAEGVRTPCALSHAYGLMGDNTRALKAIDRYFRPGMKEITRFNQPYCAALAYTSMKQNERALELLETARAVKDTSFPFFPHDARFDPLKTDPRYAKLVESLKSTRP